jgi:5-methyltetrahydrofolate--homocysteine methyltransferase
MAPMLDEITQAVVTGDAARVVGRTKRALGEGIDPLVILREALFPGMDEVGRRMGAGEYFIPEVLLSVRAMKMATQVLKPLIAQGETPPSLGRVVIGTVQGDLHDIGKNVVIMMLEGAGFEVADLGINVPDEEFIEKVRDTKPDIVAMSALITTTMGKMEDVIQGLQGAGCRGDVSIMVGGAPVNQEFATKIGADGYAPDAGSAARLARKLVTERRTA